MPSALSKIAEEKYRGAAMGVFASSEFIGGFVGGVVGGYLLGMNRGYVLIAASVLMISVALLGVKLFFSSRKGNQ